MSPDAAFNALAAAYAARALPPLRDASAPRAAAVAVGVVGNTVPVELIEACGARPWRVAPVQGDAAAADALLESFSDRDARLIFASFLAGALDGLDLLVIPRSSETWHKLYLALREAVRVGHKQGGPALWLHDVPHTQRESSRSYGLARTQELMAQLVHLTGRAPDAATLQAAVAQGNERRRLLQRLQAWRREGRVSGLQAQVATGAPHFMPAAEGLAALRAWLGGPPPPARFAGLPRLFIQGVPLDHAELHRLADASGAVVVQEDDDWGSRAASPLVASGPEPLQALFEHYWRDVPCLRIHPAPTGPSAFVQAHRAGHIDGLLFNLPRPDDLHGWRFPAQRAEADAAGLPWLCLRDDARDAPAAIQAALAPFIAGLRRTVSA